MNDAAFNKSKIIIMVVVKVIVYYGRSRHREPLRGCLLSVSYFEGYLSFGDCK